MVEALAVVDTVLDVDLGVRVTLIRLAVAITDAVPSAWSRTTLVLESSAPEIGRCRWQARKMEAERRSSSVARWTTH